MIYQYTVVAGVDFGGFADNERKELWFINRIDRSVWYKKSKDEVFGEVMGVKELSSV